MTGIWSYRNEKKELKKGRKEMFFGLFRLYERRKCTENKRRKDIEKAPKTMNLTYNYAKANTVRAHK